MAEQKNKLKVIRILDPILCVRCDSAYIADVVMSNGRRKKMFYCSRLDCDNWLSEKEAAQHEVEDLDPAA
jgi:hypothetical protein